MSLSQSGYTISVKNDFVKESLKKKTRKIVRSF